jgi:hypothetical protein
VIDLVFLPSTPDQHRAVLVEVKRADSADAPAKVVGQLLLYYSAYSPRCRTDHSRCGFLVPGQPSEDSPTGQVLGALA